MVGDRGDGPPGVSIGSPAPLFENFDGDEQLLAEAAPFRVMPTPRGRPKGAANKRTLQMRDLYLRMGLPHPMLKMGQMLQLTVEDLARLLCCSLLDAADFQRKIAADLAPYLESKMPTRVDLPTGEGLPVLVIREHDTPRAIREARRTGALAIDDDLAETLGRDEENQGVAVGDPAQSHDAGSHGAAQETDATAETSDEAGD
jgi:hypothetical protein